MSGPRAEAYLVDAVRTPVGKRGGGLPGPTPPTWARTSSRRWSSAPASIRWPSRTWYSVAWTRSARRPATSPAQRGWRPGCPRRCPAYGGPAVRFLAAGGAFRRTGGDERHRRPRRGRRRAEHEPDPDLQRDDAGSTLGFTDPFSGSRGWLARYGDQEVYQFRAAELIAEKWGISREEMERFALESHRRAAAAIDDGRFEREIVPYAGVTAATRARRRTPAWPRWRHCKTLVPGGRVTAAVGQPDLRRRQRRAGGLRAGGQGHGLHRGPGSVMSARGGDPIYMLTAPIPATSYALEKAGMKLDQIDLIEINEAFASVVLAWLGAGTRRSTRCEGQRERGRDRARPPARRDRHAPDDDDAA